ncbi:extensin-like [Zingiber officinale]|uniref:extensin-like n=1 Tax=Zingiber officinale TaxID=94328 RepID=UPI001C4AE9C6|nr:extensin-like [Zingiber officinale]
MPLSGGRFVSLLLRRHHDAREAQPPLLLPRHRRAASLLSPSPLAGRGLSPWPSIVAAYADVASSGPCRCVQRPSLPRLAALGAVSSGPRRHVQPPPHAATTSLSWPSPLPPPTATFTTSSRRRFFFTTGEPPPSSLLLLSPAGASRHGPPSSPRTLTSHPAALGAASNGPRHRVQRPPSPRPAASAHGSHLLALAVTAAPPTATFTAGSRRHFFLATGEPPPSSLHLLSPAGASLHGPPSSPCTLTSHPATLAATSSGPRRRVQWPLPPRPATPGAASSCLRTRQPPPCADRHRYPLLWPRSPLAAAAASSSPLASYLPHLSFSSHRQGPPAMALHRRRVR